MNSLSDFLGESPSTYRSFLIVGANGMLGRSWVNLLSRLNVPFEAYGRQQLDLCDNEAVKQVVAKGFHVVVNCSAYSNVDGAESDPEAADAVNHQAVKTLAGCCLQTETMLLHYSTDYVFCGHADQPYRVDDEIDPINEYGRSKAACERAVRESGCSHLIARTSWL